jgi:hypothetical protein
MKTLEIRLLEEKHRLREHNIPYLDVADVMAVVEKWLADAESEHDPDDGWYLYARNLEEYLR